MICDLSDKKLRENMLQQSQQHEESVVLQPAKIQGQKKRGWASMKQHNVFQTITGFCGDLKHAVASTQDRKQVRFDLEQPGPARLRILRNLL